MCSRFGAKFEFAINLGSSEQGRMKGFTLVRGERDETRRCLGEKIEGEGEGEREGFEYWTRVVYRKQGICEAEKWEGTLIILVGYECKYHSSDLGR